MRLRRSDHISKSNMGGDRIGTKSPSLFDRTMAWSRRQSLTTRGVGEGTNRTTSRVLFIVAAFALFLVPVAAIAAGGFTDVGDDNNVFKTDIEWMADAGVTKGCNPPTNDEFCPEANVTREQMAAFMHRLAINKVVDAKTAMDADKLDGKDSTAFVQKGEADSVSSLMMTDSVGVAQATRQPPMDVFSKSVNVLSVQVKAPAAGYVLVQSTYMARIDHVEGFEDKCAFDVSAISEARPSDIAPHIIVPKDAPTGQHAFVSAASRVYPVAGAGTYTFYLVGEEVGAGTDCGVANIALTGLYVPVAYGDI